MSHSSHNSSSSSSTLLRVASQHTLPDVHATTTTAVTTASRFARVDDDRHHSSHTGSLASRHVDSDMSSSNSSNKDDDDDDEVVTVGYAAADAAAATAPPAALNKTAPPSIAHSTRASISAAPLSSSSSSAASRTSMMASAAAAREATRARVVSRRSNNSNDGRDARAMRLCDVRDAHAPHIVTLSPPMPLLQQQQLPSSSSAAQAVVCTRRLVHPHGFRVLREDSVVERALRSYFRLPPAPSLRLSEERARLQRTLLRLEQSAQQRAQARWRRRRRQQQLLYGDDDDDGGGEVGVLDGFCLMQAACRQCGNNGSSSSSGHANEVVCEPTAVTAATLHDAALVRTAPDDLTYFTRLTFLDVSENALSLEQLLPLRALVTLHLSCNKMHTLRGLWCAAVAQREAAAGNGDDGNDNDNNSSEGEVCDVASSLSSSSSAVFPCLRTLNLSYNRIVAAEVTMLSCLPALTQLDLSGNELRWLPRDLSSLAHVTHLALEYNELTTQAHDDDDDDEEGQQQQQGEDDDVFASLATMPSLVEVNLNHNRLAHVPVSALCGSSSNNNTKQQQQQQLYSDEASASPCCFPCLQVISLADNAFATPHSVCALAQRHDTLRHVHLAGNPLCRQRTLRDATQHAMDAVVLDAYVRHVQVHTTRTARHATSTSARMTTTTTTAAVGGDNGAAAAAASADAMSYVTRHRVLVHYDDATTLPVRSARFFYATQTCAPAQRDALVTLPSDVEFMDIYRLLRGRRGRRQRRQDDTATSDEATAAADALAQNVPPSSLSQQQQQQQQQHNNNNDVADDDADDVGFFLTSMRHIPAAASATTTAADEATQHDDAKDTTTTTTTTHANTTTATQRPPLVSATVTNVHAAMTELRAMLRKPLPPLPFVAPSRRRGGTR